MKILIILCLVLFCAFLKPVLNYDGNDPKSLLVTSANTLNGALRVGNEINNYVTFDIKEFLTVPYTNTWNDKGGRQYFLNFFFKSSLFGEYNFSKGIPKDILDKQAIIMSYLFLFILLIFIIGISLIVFDSIKHLKGVLEERSVFALIPAIILLFFSALVCMRYLYPFSCQSDFRFIYPIIIPVAGAIAYGAYKLKNYGKMGIYAARIAEILSYVFVAASAAFFMSFIASYIG